VDALLLCQWDNILGPRTEHVWYVSGRPQPHSNILRYITTQVLGGEICRDVTSSQIDFKFFDVPAMGIIFPSFIFSAQGQGSSGLTLQSLVLIIPNSELALYLHQVDLINSWMTRIVAKLRVICEMKDFATSGLADLTSWLHTFMTMLSSLQQVGLPSHITLQYTALCPTHSLEPEFLRQVISSHLMTYGRTLVIGHRADQVNVLVYTLGLFCWEGERMRSRTALGGEAWPYFADLCVQGCIKGEDGAFPLTLREIQVSQYPVTLVDVERRDVMQSSSLVDHRRLRQAALLEELSELWRGEGGSQGATKGQFYSTHTQESLVRDLISQVHKLPPEAGVREAFISHFMHSLQRRAAVVLTWLEGEGSNLAGGKGLVKKLRGDLGLSLEGDWRMVMAQVDKLRPGTLAQMQGETRSRSDAHYLPNMVDVL